jgi:UDP-glucose 4-epimerase
MRSAQQYSSILSKDFKLLLVGGCGYIGSYIYQKALETGITVTVCDTLTRGNPLNIPVLETDYVDLDQGILDSYHAILWFAGHSSVTQSVQDPNGALKNNCLNLYSFARKIPAYCKFIYASSGSLYSRRAISASPSSETSLAEAPSQNAYDISKFAFDYLAQNFLKNYFALRMGTVSGYSPNLRKELVFNAMNLSAFTTGTVNLMNRKSLRTILHLTDLWQLIFKLLTTPQMPGIYNVGSSSFTMEQLAAAVAQTWDAEVVYAGDTDTYSFTLDTRKMDAVCGTGLLRMSIGDRCRVFIEEYSRNSGGIA